MSQKTRVREKVSCGKHIEDRKLGLFQDASFADDLQDSKSISVGILCVFDSHTFCFDFLDVHEAIRSVPQQCRFGNHFAWCRFADGMFTSCRKLWASTCRKKLWLRSSQQSPQLSSDPHVLLWGQCCSDWNDNKKDEAQRWGTSQELTESIWIGSLSESIWTSHLGSRGHR